MFLKPRDPVVGTKSRSMEQIAYLSVISLCPETGIAWFRYNIRTGKDSETSSRDMRIFTV